MDEETRNLQVAIFRCQNEKAVEIDPEKKKKLAQQEHLLRQQLHRLKRKPKLEGKTRTWIVLMDLQNGALTTQPFYPSAYNLPGEVLIEMATITNVARETVAFLRELGIRWDIPAMRMLAQKDLRKTFGLPNLRVVSRAELLIMAKRGEVQVRITSDEEDEAITKHMQEVLKDGKENTRGAVGLRPSTGGLRPGRAERGRGDHREEGLQE